VKPALVCFVKNNSRLTKKQKHLYVNLNCHTYYSLKYGTRSPAQLVEDAKAQGVDTLVLTDINNTSAAYSFYKAAKEAGIHPVLGVEYRNGDELLFIGIAQNQEGWYQLCKLLTEYSMLKQALPYRAPDLPDCFFIYRLGRAPDAPRENEYIGVMMHEVNLLYRSPLLQQKEKLVALCPVTFKNKDGYLAHKLLRAIDKNVLITQLNPESLAHISETFHPTPHIHSHYAAYPFLIDNALSVLSKCSIEFTPTHRNNRRSFTGSKKEDLGLLRKLAYNGLYKRYESDNEEAHRRVEKELGVIDKMDFASYFLITWDIIRYAHSMGYYHIGRGSGANSIVAFCLYITDVDPIELNLFFERFINPYRSSPPDFDIDFSWDERDDITDYIFKRYGYEYTALLATYNTFKGKSVIRELGKVFGLPKAEIDKIVLHPNDTHTHHESATHIFKYADHIIGLPNYLSIHAGGILITERPINYFTALKLMPKGFPITHFDMYGAEDLELHKFDILSQRGLGHIKDAVKLVQSNQGKNINIRDVEKIKEDKKVRTQLRSGRCMGCFYIESPAMRGLLSKLTCKDYVHLVAASSIIRPGVAKSGMMREYIKRFHNPQSYSYLHPIFEQQLGETYGVMVYQEDVMKIVHHFAGLDLDESDVLRRIMTGKRKSQAEFLRLQEKFFTNCKVRGYSDELSLEVWRQVESFSGYSFCKAHSASYAMESFQSLYLKAHFPLEFMVGVINNFGGFYRTEYYVHEARMCGAIIEAPCVNHSEHLTTIYGETIYLGFVHLNGMERKLADRIVRERRRAGPFLDLADFTSRVKVGSEALDVLIRINAFRFSAKNKYELMWEKNGVHNDKRDYHTGALFADIHEDFTLPQLREGADDQIFDEIELLGFPLQSPFYLLESKPPQIIPTLSMLSHADKRIDMLGYYVCTKPVRTSNGKHMMFGTWIDEAGHFFDTTHFPNSLTRFPFRGKGIYHLRGKITVDFGFPALEVDWMERLPYRKDGRY